MSEQIVKIGDSRELIKELPDNYIDCVITSPPYYKMRIYKLQSLIYGGNPSCQHKWSYLDSSIGSKPHTGNNTTGFHNGIKENLAVEKTNIVYGICQKCSAFKGELGWEPTPEMFIDHLIEIFEVIRPKIKNTGSLWINLGDKWIDGDLALIPEQFALGMKKKGWILINKITWVKGNNMPESVKRRLTKTSELIFHFVKNRNYWYNLDIIRVPHSTSTIQRISQPNVMNQRGGFKQDILRGNPASGNASRCNKMVQSLAMKYNGKFSEVPEDCEQYGSPRARTQRDKYSDSGSRTSEGLHENRWNEYFHSLGKNPGDTLFVNTSAYNGAHFAVFPLDLIKLPITATTPKYICKKCGTPRERIYKPIPLPDSSLSYNSKYKDQDIGQAPQGFTRSNTIARERDQSRTIAKELYPDDPEAQQEYINYIHDHGGTTRQEFAGYSDCGCGAPFESGWVLDPFCGSGTTLEFCRQNGYNAIGFELQPIYKKLIEQRSKILIPQIKNIDNAQYI